MLREGVSRRVPRRRGRTGAGARHGLAAAMVRFTACVSAKSLESGKSVPARLLVGMTSQVYGAIADALEGPGGMAREDAPHAEACALHVLRCGVIARLDEPGRGSLLRSLASIFFFFFFFFWTRRIERGSNPKPESERHRGISR